MPTTDSSGELDTASGKPADTDRPYGRDRNPRGLLGTLRPLFGLRPRDKRSGSFAELAETRRYWAEKNRIYHDELRNFYRHHILPGCSVLEVGCATGDLLAAIPTDDKVGIDRCEQMIRRAKSGHPDIRFIVMDGALPALRKKFDYIILSDLLGHLDDIQQTLSALQAVCHRRSRILMNSYNHLWQPLLALAEQLGLKMPERQQNWLNSHDISNFLELAGFTVLHEQRRMLLPARVPVLGTLCNKLLAHLPGLSRLCLIRYVVARPSPKPYEAQQLSLSVIIPARNEAGTIEEAVQRIPDVGAFTEIIFIEGHSTDHTLKEIERVAHQYGNLRKISWAVQEGRGKADAVRLGFRMARGDILVILDADLTVPPEDLPKFFEGLASNKMEFANGCRLVYPLEEESMQYLNLVGNKCFSQIFTWLLNQPVKDTLCGTKALFRKDYCMLEKHRNYFGDFDPFGDFDLLFGAARMNLEIKDIPVHYQRRHYGETNIQRWRHGWLLLRMSWLALLKIKLI